MNPYSEYEMRIKELEEENAVQLNWLKKKDKEIKQLKGRKLGQLYDQATELANALSYVLERARDYQDAKNRAKYNLKRWEEYNAIHDTRDC